MWQTAVGRVRRSTAYSRHRYTEPEENDEPPPPKKRPRDATMAPSPHGPQPRSLHCAGRPTRGVKGDGRLLFLLYVVLAAACETPPAVVIQDHCEPLSDAVLVHRLDFPGLYSVGLVQDHLLFSYAALSGDPERPVRVRAQWFDPELSAVGEEIGLGSGSPPMWRWVAFEGRLWAQIWTVPETVEELPLPRQRIAIYTVEPRSREAVRIQRDLPISTVNDDRPDLTPVGIGSSFVSGFPQARAAAAVGHGRPVFALNAVPAVCPGPIAQPSPLMLFDTMNAYTHLLTAADCNAPDTRGWEHSATLVSLLDGGLGVLFRSGDTLGHGQLWYSKVGADLSLLDEPPLLVGSTTRHVSTPGGYEPRAAVVGEGTILFTERNEESDENLCSNLRLVEPDGSNPRHAPWQLPCYERPGSFEEALRAVGHGREPPEGSWAPTVSAWIVVEPLPNGRAALVWGERTSFPTPNESLTRLTPSVPYEEGVFLATIDGQGRRASERVRVTPPEATAIAGTREDGWPGEFEVQAATEGDVVVVVWRDLRADAPGYYARRFRCAPIGE